MEQTQKLKNIAELSEEMQGFLEMEGELEYAAFIQYYAEVMDFLQADYQELSREDLIIVGAILQILAANAMDRSMKKDANYKKFKKVSEKSTFWYNAIELRVLKEHSLDKKALAAEVDKVFKDPEQTK